MDVKKIQVIDLFCGAGGLSYGFSVEKSSCSEFVILGAADFNKTSLRTYSQNIGAPVFLEDLGKVASSEKLISEFVSRFQIDRRYPLIVIGGPPCQGFSAHSKKQRNTCDDRNDLVQAFAKIAVAFEPDLVAFENVPEVMTEKNWAYFEPMVETFAARGLHLNAKVHNLAEFGVPQERFRALLVASKTALPELVPTHGQKDFRTVRDAIGTLPQVLPGKQSTDPMHFCAAHRQSTIDVIRQVPKDGGNRPMGVGPACLAKVDGYRDVYGRLSWDKPAVTITASARNPASGRFTHPEQHRGLTVREAALLQGFPAGYLFEGTFDEKFLQIGNAVPPAFSSVLARHILSNLPLKNTTLNRKPKEPKRSSVRPLKNSFSSSLFMYKKRDSGAVCE
jgi:DNA (cytosine-5)-methyltransferase 1